MLRIFAAFITLALIGHLSTLPAVAADTSAFSAAQKGEFGKLVREYLLEHPEVITEALTELDSRAEKARVDNRANVLVSRRQELLSPSEGTVIGNPRGDVTVVEFFDYNCGYCKSMFQSMVEILKEDPEMRLVLKEYPILGPSSVTASRAALAARNQGKYSDLHLALLSFKGSLSDSVIMVIAQNAGLDVRKLQEDMKDPEITDILVKNHSLADELGVEGTPQVIIGEVFLPGAVPKEEIVAAIAKARR